MRILIVSSMLFLGGCAAVTSTIQQPTLSSSQETVVGLELEYVQKFLVPAAAYTLLPRCPQSAATTCSDPTIVAGLRAAEIKVHNAIYALRDLSDAAPSADASSLIANARAALDSAEAILPKTGGAP